MTNIRFALSKDMPRVVALCQAHATYEKADYQPEGKTKQLSDSFFEYPPAAYCLVVEHHHQIVGYATFMKQFSTWDAAYYLYLDCLYFEPEARGLGLGKLVMDAVWAFAKAENCRRIEWQTPDFNESAIGFYKKLGAYGKTKERFFWLL